MKVNEIFEGIQGEGKFVGTPCLFIRLSGCNRDCSWCDTKYHKQGKEVPLLNIVKVINESKLEGVVWTGGEPCLQREAIGTVITHTRHKKHMIETNGTITDNKFLMIFDYISFSPKSRKDAKKLIDDMDLTLCHYDIKVVTDLRTVGRDMIKYSTMLMPLTTYNKKKDEEIKKKVWDYCLKYNIKYSPRLQVDVWGMKRRV